MNKIILKIIITLLLVTLIGGCSSTSRFIQDDLAIFESNIQSGLETGYEVVSTRVPKKDFSIKPEIKTIKNNKKYCKKSKNKKSKNKITKLYNIKSKINAITPYKNSFIKQHKKFK